MNDYAFFDGSKNPVVDGIYTYQNVFDASYDSLVFVLTLFELLHNVNYTLIVTNDKS